MEFEEVRFETCSWGGVKCLRRGPVNSREICLRNTGEGIMIHSVNQQMGKDCWLMIEIIVTPILGVAESILQNENCKCIRKEKNNNLQLIFLRPVIVAIIVIRVSYHCY